MFLDRIVEQRLEQSGAFSVRHAPAHDPSAVNVEDDIKIEVAPLRRSHQFGDVPRPDFVWTFRQKFRFLINRVAQLPAAFADLALAIEDPVHRSDRAVINTLVEQGRINLGWRLIGEARRMQHIQHGLLLRLGQRAGWPRPWKREPAAW